MVHSFEVKDEKSKQKIATIQNTSQDDPTTRQCQRQDNPTKKRSQDKRRQDHSKTNTGQDHLRIGHQGEKQRPLQRRRQRQKQGQRQKQKYPPSETRQDNHKAKQDKTMSRQMEMEDTTRQDKTRQDKTRQDKTHSPVSRSKA